MEVVYAEKNHANILRSKGFYHLLEVISKFSICKLITMTTSKIFRDLKRKLIIGSLDFHLELFRVIYVEFL